MFVAGFIGSPAMNLSRARCRLMIPPASTATAGPPSRWTACRAACWASGRSTACARACAPRPRRHACPCGGGGAHRIGNPRGGPDRRRKGTGNQLPVPRAPEHPAGARRSISPSSRACPICSTRRAAPASSPDIAGPGPWPRGGRARLDPKIKKIRQIPFFAGKRGPTRRRRARGTRPRRTDTRPPSTNKTVHETDSRRNA